MVLVVRREIIFGLGSSDRGGGIREVFEKWEYFVFWFRVG